MKLDEINKLTRVQLVNADIAIGIAKWGEAEQAGIERTAARKSDATLRAEMAVREGCDHNRVKGAVIVHQPTLGALEDGIS